MEKGDRLPVFHLPDQDGKQVSYAEYSGRWLVLYFYPKDNTSGCTKEAVDFSSLRKDFQAEGCSILGVSPDSPESHRRFIEKLSLSLRLLSDPEKKLMKPMGAWGMKKNYGREYEGVIRSTFLVEPDGIIAEVWRKVAVRRKTKTCEILHAQRVLEKLKELKSKC